MTNEAIMAAYSKWWNETVGKGESAGLHTAWFASIEACADEIRREERNKAEEIVCAYWPDEDFIRAAILSKEEP